RRQGYHRNGRRRSAATHRRREGEARRIRPPVCSKPLLGSMRWNGVRQRDYPTDPPVAENLILLAAQNPRFSLAPEAGEPVCDGGVGAALNRPLRICTVQELP